MLQRQELPQPLLLERPARHRLQAKCRARAPQPARHHPPIPEDQADLLVGLPECPVGLVGTMRLQADQSPSLTELPNLPAQRPHPEGLAQADRVLLLLPLRAEGRVVVPRPEHH